ncbi:VOC family protein [Alkalibacterium putridalgicola]|jgi:lactoylglutathione lyase|uniref:Aldoketomutase n=1 Tax=Alkalibacterium putridalgicola TaxID=426703 RepID=A0A1H7S0N9_9LACT|nr:VOC family protein [Alkalibacterium putridalgicola]GEK88357.1 lactoylglutathione lyase [Alkalibacterium putridalgicola]SEL66082.1 lactoylglutathione lyase [Alkalibacterium putridalgicola]
MSKKMIHTCIRVKNLEKSVAFYKDVLGMEEVRRLDYPEYKFTLVYLALPGDGYELELTYNYDQAEPYDLGNGYGHIAIGVNDLEDIHEEYSQSGYMVTDLKGLSDGAASYFFIKDPDGYKIEIVQL